MDKLSLKGILEVKPLVEVGSPSAIKLQANKIKKF